jgi:hypothetical protein
MERNCQVIKTHFISKNNTAKYEDADKNFIAIPEACKYCKYYGLIYVEKPLGGGLYSVGCKEPEAKDRPTNCPKWKEEGENNGL